MTLISIPLELVIGSDYARALSEPALESLMHSIDQVGLLQPILVIDTKVNRGVMVDGFRVVAGHHRVEAFRRLGLTHIDATVLNYDMSHIETELIEIDENLCRAELTPAQRAAAIKRRRQIWDALHPDKQVAQIAPPVEVKKHGHAQASAFAAETAKVSGESKSQINRHLARAEALGDDLQAVAGTSLDKGVELDALKEMPAPERKQIIVRARGGEKVSARSTATRLSLTIEYVDVGDGAFSIARSIILRDRALARALVVELKAQLAEAA
ncbi:MAG: ParB-like nuclease domain-containing protein [Rhodocyclaceae bacterium]|nr:ParB-like nuclease domain-containing protein [Rhodocyclaceae bacterium]